MAVILTSKVRISPDTWVFRFRTVDGGAVHYAPGQFFRFTFTDAEGAFERSYSLCNYNTQGDILDLVISEVKGGRATALLFAAEAGLTAEVTGPYGKLILPTPLPERVVLMAASVGIAPYLPMLATLEPQLQAGSVHVTLLLGVREPSGFLYQDLLRRLVSLPGFELYVCYSRQLPGAPQPFEHKGYVQKQLSDLNLDSARDFVLLCGNPQMVDDCRRTLSDLGFARRRVRHEKYVFAPRIVEGEPVPPTDEQKKLIAEKLARYTRKP